ncbi:MAG: MBL fold metallo-hydrolase [Dehalococcoidia bacterium]
MYRAHEAIPGVFEVTLEHGEDPVGFFGGGAIAYSLWFLPAPNAAIIDPGPTTVATVGLQAIRDLGYDPTAVEYVVATHIHVDHGGGCGYLLQELPRARAVIHARGAEHMRDPSRLIAGTAAVFGEKWQELFGAILPVPQERMIVVDDGDALTLGGRRHRVLYLPGHAPHHIGLYDEETGAVYCGHGLGMPRPGSPLPDPPSTLPFFDVDAALASIARVRSLNPRHIFYSHYGMGGGDPKAEIDTAERVTRDMGEIVTSGTEEGASVEEMERRLKAYVYGDPSQTSRTYAPIVRAYMAYFQRQASR